MMMRCLLLTALATLLALCGCANPGSPTPSYNYTNFKQSRPASIVVLPPLNETTDVKASDGFLSQVTMPLAESGYYVLPVALVLETFRQNGLSNAHDAHQVDIKKLREIFGADAALYITVTNYGAKYMVVQSNITVAATARLVDLKTGKKLWDGSAFATNNQGNNNSAGLLGTLIIALVTQAINSSTDASVNVAGVAANRLLTAQKPRGLLFGPRSIRYNTD